ncbi:MAG: alpha/beta hydrolase fold domain-containing protein [Pseudomonadota bacterium]
MTLDIATTAFLSQMAVNSEKPLHEMEVDEARTVLGSLAPFFGEGPEMAETRSLTAKAADGADIPMLALIPKGAPQAVMVYYHGGGFVLGDIEQYASHGRRLAERCRSVVVLVGYRKAPEHPFPAAPNDSWDALNWVDQNMESLAGARLPLMVAGDSAGGCLAAVVAQRAAREGAPQIALQVLAYPVTDASMSTASYEAPENQLLLNAPLMAWFFDHYAPEGVDRGAPEISPLNANDLSGVAPALVLTAEHDVLTDEALAYADKLKAAGVSVTAKSFAGQMHNFVVMHNVLPGAAAALDWTADQIDEHLAATASAASDVDTVVVGAGFAGLYSLHKMRELGLKTRVLEAGGDVGGTWYWNRYPGARCDVESMAYSYSFSEELDQEWEWSQRYAPQPEILKYANHVADKFEFRKDISFNTRVTKAVYDEERSRWTVFTDSGEAITAQYLIMATGVLSVVKDIDIQGVDQFQGPSYVTGRWPHEGVDFTGKKVAVIGTGSSGVQAIPEIAAQASSLTVYQRTPAYSSPAHNRPLTEAEIAERKREYPTFRQQQKWSSFGFGYGDVTPPKEAALQTSEADRRKKYEDAWASGSLIALGLAYQDVILDLDANKTVGDFVTEKLRAAVKDPEVAEKLTPKTYPIMSKRPCIDSGYYEAFNQPHVSLVSLKETPIETITATGVRTTAGEESYDAIVYATGFDAVTGALNRIEIRGIGGERLKDKWAAGARSYLGVAVGGFPNMFTITGPSSPSVMSNMMVSIEQHVDWVGDCIAWMRANGIDAIEPEADAEAAWVAHVAEVADRTVAKYANSWYVGANVPGKPREFLAYFGGVNTYRAICDSIAAQGYHGFKTHGGALAMAAE